MAIKWIPTSEDIKKIETLAGYGLSIARIAGVFGISKATMERRQSEYPDVSEAIEKGRALAESAVTQTAYKMAVSGNNTAMTIFWLKTRAKWRESDSEQLTGAIQSWIKKAY